MTQKETQGKFAQKFDENSPQMNHGKQFGKTLGKEPGDLSEPGSMPEKDPSETDGFLKRLGEAGKGPCAQARRRPHRSGRDLRPGNGHFDVSSLRQKIVLTCIPIPRSFSSRPMASRSARAFRAPSTC